MGALITAGVMFVATAAAGVAGLAFGRRLPGHHLDTDSRDAVRLVAGFLAALTALVLGLLLASAKANYDQHNGQLHQIAADVVALDRVLARYGDGAREARVVLRSTLADEFARLSEHNLIRGNRLQQPVQDIRVVGFYDRLQVPSRIVWK